MNEHEHQAALIKWWALSHKRYRLPEYSLMAIPNGSHRHIAVARKLKAEGVRKGVSDLLLRVSSCGFNALWIELKARRNKPTKEQLEFQQWQTEEGALCVVCYGWEAAKDTIESYLKERV